MIAKNQTEIPASIGSNLVLAKKILKDAKAECEKWEAQVREFLTVGNEIIPGYFENIDGGFSVSAGGRINMNRGKK